MAYNEYKVFVRRRIAVQHRVDLLATFNRARTEGTVASVLRERSRGSAAAGRIARRLARASGAFWLEWHREIRCHAGNDRLPSDLRARLREAARRSLARSAAASRAVTPFPRRLLRERVNASLPPALLAEASKAAAGVGIPLDRPVVALEVRRRPDTFSEAIPWLVSEGYCVVRIGDAPDPIQPALSAVEGRPGVIDLPASSRRTPLLELFVLQTSRFVVCESLHLQQMAYLTNTPSLLLNAPDPFGGYPVRQDSVYTLSAAIDLDTGEALTSRDRLGEQYFRNLRNIGFRHNGAAEVLAAVREMHDGVTIGWRETASQALFRELVIQAGASLAASVPLVAEWGPDEEFIGDGRLARWQAERVQ